MKISINNEKYEPAPEINTKKSFRDLSLKKKAEYIWDYYKWWFITAAAIIILAITTIPGIIENGREVVLYSVFLNTNIRGQEYTSLMDDFTEEAGIDMNGKKIVLDCSLFIDRNNPTAAMMQSSQKLTVLFANSTIDVIISDESNFKFCSSQGAYMDLREFLPKDLCDKYSSLFIEAENPETGEMTAYGLDLSQSELLKEEHAFSFEPVLSVCMTTEQADNAISFIKYLLGESL